MNTCANPARAGAIISSIYKLAFLWRVNNERILEVLEIFMYRQR